jgi:hypothetical protein
MHDNDGPAGGRNSGARHGPGGGHPLDGFWPSREGGGQPDEINLSPQGQLAAFRQDQLAWP